MRIAALTQGPNIPSSRFRVRQLIDPLSSFGYELTEFPADPIAYPPAGRLARLHWLASAAINSWHRARSTIEFDAAIIQRELISTLPSFEGMLKAPFVADIDDAIWHYRGGHAAAHLARSSRHIVVGNSHLADYFGKFRRTVTVIPTGVDTDRFSPRTVPSNRSYGVIAWSGTWGGYAYFEPLQKPLTAILKKWPEWKIRFISDRPPNLPMLPPNQVEYFPWSVSTEAALTADMDIGLMPLDDSPWSLGKCSYKMLLYMASGVPVVATNLGMNSELLRMSEIGIGASNSTDWYDALDYLISSEQSRRQAGACGRRLVEHQFSLKVVTQQWRHVLSSLSI